MLFVALLFGPCILNAITQFMTSWIKSIKLQTLIAQYSPLNDGELWMSYKIMRWCFLQCIIEASRKGNEEEKLKFYTTSCSFCLCNSACSLQSLDHVGLRKWGLAILGTGAYFTHPCPALCNHPAPENPQTCLIMPVHVEKLCSGLRAWGVNSSGPAGIIILSFPTLQVGCLVSRVLLSARGTERLCLWEGPTGPCFVSWILKGTHFDLCMCLKILAFCFLFGQAGQCAPS